jgi:hypothetical protein
VTFTNSVVAVGPTNGQNGSGVIDARATCPPTKRVVNGGFNLPSGWGRYLTLISSYPEVGASDSWYIQLRNNTSLNLGSPVAVTAYAICVDR